MKALVISSPMFAEIRGQTAASLLEGKKKPICECSTYNITLRISMCYSSRLIDTGK